MRTQRLLANAACALALPAALAIAAGTAATQAQAADKSLQSCPARKPVLRIATVTGDEIYSPHPAESRFSSTHYARLHQMPLFGVNPLETEIDASYGLAESWKFKPKASGLLVKLKKGLTFNNGDPVTAEDVVFSLQLTASKFADGQISGTLRRIGVKAKVVDANTVEIDFKRGSPTFDLEMSPLVFPIYVTSKKYHSNGEISEKAFDAFRKNPLAAGPYKVIARQPEKFMTLVADRKDPLLGCPVYERIEIRTVLETGTRMSQFRTGQQDIIVGSRDLIPQAKRVGARVASKPDANLIGLYIFQSTHKDNVFSNVDVRKAAAHAINHELIGKAIWGGVGIEPWGCTWPPPTEISAKNPRYGKACGKPYPYDPKKAKEHLAKAGYKDGKGPRIRIEYSVSYPEEAALAEAMLPMLKAVGFDPYVERVDRSERNRRRFNNGHINTLLFFGPGGRVTSLAGAVSVWGPRRGWGPKDDKDVVGAIDRAAKAVSLDEYTNAMSDLAEVIHSKAYGPGFFSAGSIFFVRKNVPDWGLEKSKGRGPLNLSALVTKR